MLLSALSLTLIGSALALPQAAPSASSVPAPTGDQYNSVTFEEGNTLEECSFVEQRWADPRVPKGEEPKDREYSVSINFLAYTGDPNTRNGNYLVVPTGDSGANRTYSRQVTWPAGTTLEISNSAKADGSLGPSATRWDEMKTYQIVPGASQDCIPQSAYPIKIDESKLQNVASCSEVELAWNGSAPRYDVSIITFNTNRSRRPETIQNLSSLSTTWKVAYPNGTLFAVQVTGANSSSALVQGFQVGPETGENCTIPPENQYARPLSDETMVQGGGSRLESALSSSLMLMGLAVGVVIIL